MEQVTRLCVTDIGSTTTKAVLLSCTDRIWSLTAVANAPTTVEQPENDVKIGVFYSIQALEEKAGISLLSPASTSQNLAFLPEVKYLCTSSAGGGLQILVIGLTLSDSASSAKRASYGAGGVILDTFAIDDKRSSIEQMLLMRKLHPDMILLSGGTDGGALSSVLRLAEIIRIANPKPKYESGEKVPLIYAGNEEADELIEKIVSDSFDLHILPNLRPTMQKENLKPTQELIQRLFMENVMEQAPGYKELKKLVEKDIIPTPIGVLNSLCSLTSHQTPNVFAFDIGGATTDVFSYVHGHYQRTVSANLGMSYSALNVLKEAGVENIMRWLSPEITETELSNYIGNKTLYPTYNPCQDRELMIEHAIAKEAMRMALSQHRDMHYNTKKIGFLDLMKTYGPDKYESQFNFQALDETYYFYPSDIDIVMGAGGVFSHCQKIEHAMMMLIDATIPKGITEIWIDQHFITPHLGVLSTYEESVATALLKKEAIQRIAIHISPLFTPKRKDYPVLELVMESDPKLLVLSNQFLYYPATGKKRQIKINTLNHSYLNSNLKEYDCETDLAIIIDTRANPEEHTAMINSLMNLYKLEPNPLTFNMTHPKPEIYSGKLLRKLELPYQGEISVREGDLVQADDIIACNRYSPPRLYVVSVYQDFKNLSEEILRDSILVKPGDKIDLDDRILQITEEIAKLSGNHRHRVFYSPVRGKIEFINFKSGIIILSEIQDYAINPVKINVATLLNVKPKQIVSYMKKNTGDFVYRGDSLCSRVIDNKGISNPVFVRAPETGTITKIDLISGNVHIHYNKEPHNYLAHVPGKVLEVNAKSSLTIEYSGIRYEGMIGFGTEQHGELKIIRQKEDLYAAELAGVLLYCSFDMDMTILDLLVTKKIKALIVSLIDEATLIRFMKFEPGLINTGNETLPYSILICEGFGKLKQESTIDGFFIKAEGKTAYFDPHTRIRAGVIRPSFTVLEY